MKLLNNIWPGYEELKSFYPLFYQEVYEMDAILKAEGKLIDDIKNGIERIFGDRFIMTSDSDTISVYEKIMGITPDMTKNLQERRLLIKTLLSGSGKLSASQIKAIVKNYTGTECDIRLEKQKSGDEHDTLMIRAELHSNHDLSFSDLNTALYEKLPSHINYHMEFDHPFTIEILSEFETISAAYESNLEIISEIEKIDNTFQNKIEIISETGHIDNEYRNEIQILTDFVYYETPVPQCGRFSCGEQLLF